MGWCVWGMAMRGFWDDRGIQTPDRNSKNQWELRVCVELDRKSTLLWHLESLSMDLFELLSEYAVKIDRARGFADPAASNATAVIEEARLKVAVAGHLHGFDRLFESFIRSLSGAELKSVRGLQFLFDEVRKNQAKIDAIHAAHQAHLEWLRGPAGSEPPAPADLKALPIADTILMVESFWLFVAALGKLFPREYENVWHAITRGSADLESLTNSEIRKAVRTKSKRLKSRGIRVEPSIKAAIEKLHGL